MTDEHIPRRGSIKNRRSKVKREDLGSVPSSPATFISFIDTLPNILAAYDFRQLSQDIIQSRSSGKGIIIGLGGHVIKTGVAPYLIELMKAGFVRAIALNGAALIHDFELAFSGKTSEDVEQEIVSGNFGFAQETGALLNDLITEAYRNETGLGEIMTRRFPELGFPHIDISIVGQAGLLDIPVSVHVAIGTDIIHMHPECDGAAIGQSTFNDFRRYCDWVVGLDGGGGYINIGSAVILPEIFLKALSLARNRNPNFHDFFTANFDFIRQYRPMQSIINRPQLLGARTYSLIGHHEILIPLITQAVLEKC